MTVSALIIPCIALCFLAMLVDRFVNFLEQGIKRIKWLPLNRIDGTIAYLIVFAAGFFVCWRGHFDFFTFLGFAFNRSWEGWLLTSLVLSGGSKFVRESFGLTGFIPQVISGVYSTFSSLGNSTAVDAPVADPVAPATPTASTGDDVGVNTSGTPL
jgi:small-conductance mechanosensitive channel